jgi:hypothetical protein
MSQQIGGLGQLDAYYKGRLAQDEASHQEAQAQAAVEGSTADKVWLRWRTEAIAAIAAQRGLTPGSGLSFSDQALAHERVHAIAARYRAEREKREQLASAEYERWRFGFQQWHGRQPTAEERAAAGYGEG